VIGGGRNRPAAAKEIAAMDKREWMVQFTAGVAALVVGTGIITLLSWLASLIAH
jgi:hypothetical protein